MNTTPEYLEWVADPLGGSEFFRLRVRFDQFCRHNIKTILSGEVEYNPWLEFLSYWSPIVPSLADVMDNALCELHRISKPRVGLGQGDVAAAP